MLNFWLKFKTFFGHRLILELAIIGTFMAFTLNPGSIGDFMRICAAIFLFNVLIGNYRIGDVTEGHLVILGIFLIMLLINGFMPDEMVHRRSFRYFLTIPGMVFAVHCLSKRANPSTKTIFYYGVIAGLAVIIQLITYHTIERVAINGGYESMGLYSNIHHFGAYASLILTILFYFATRFKGWPRLLCIAGVVIAFYLMWESSSRISWLSFYTAILLAIVLFFRKREFIIAATSILIVSFIGAYLSGFGAIKNRVMDLLMNWRTEERVTVWFDTVRMLFDNSISDWIFGHGIGSFRYYFSDYSTLKLGNKVIVWNFPHNVILQLIFENGLIGLLMILAGVILLLVGLRRGYRLLENKSDRYLLVTLFVLFWTNFIHCALTLSFYQKYFIYPLSMIIGISLILLEKTGQNRPLKSLNWFQVFANILLEKMPTFNRWLR